MVSFHLQILYLRIFINWPGEILSFEINNESINQESRTYWDPKENTNDLTFDENILIIYCQMRFK